MKRAVLSLFLSLGGLAFIAASPVGSVSPRAGEGLPIDTLEADTLREVIVTASDSIKMPLSKNVMKDAAKTDYSLGGLLQRYAPTLNDQITHPFGFKERKQARKKKKVNKVLEQLDALDANSYYRELDEVMRKEGLVK